MIRLTISSSQYFGVSMWQIARNEITKQKLDSGTISATQQMASAPKWNKRRFSHPIWQSNPCPDKDLKSFRATACLIGYRNFLEVFLVREQEHAVYAGQMHAKRGVHQLHQQESEARILPLLHGDTCFCPRAGPFKFQAPTASCLDSCSSDGCTPLFLCQNRTL